MLANGTILRGIGSRVSNNRSVSDEEARYVVALMREWLAEDPGRTQLELAKTLGVEGATVSTVLSGKRGVGHKLLSAFAELRSLTAGAFRAEAATFAQRKPASPTPDTTVEYTDRYANRATAIAATRGEYAPEVVAHVASLDLHSPNDLTVREWIQELDDAEKALRRGTLRPSKDELAKSAEIARDILKDWPEDAFAAPDASNAPGPSGDAPTGAAPATKRRSAAK